MTGKKTSTYYDGFINACGEMGLNKNAADRLYKTAARPGLFTSLYEILHGTVGVGRNAAHGVNKTLSGINKGLEFVNAGGGSASALSQKAIADSMTRGWLSHIPGVRSFGRGFSRSHYGYLRDLKAGKAAPELLKMFGITRGSLLGNTLAGLGSFSASHPLIGAAAYMTPAIWLSKKFDKANDEKGDIDVMTPAQKRIFDRVFYGGGYSGLGFDADDVSLFGAL